MTRPAVPDRWFHREHEAWKARSTRAQEPAVPAEQAAIEEAECPDCGRGSETLARLLARNQQLEQALAFYADRENWTQMTSWGGRIWDDEGKALDGGRIARAALAGAAGSQEP